MTDKIKKVDDDTLIIETTTTTEQLVKKSSLDGRRATLVAEHTKALAEIDAQLDVFK